MTVCTDRARYGVMPTPSYDSFETVTVTVNAPGGGFAFTDELTVSQAYALASELMKWSNVVRNDT